MEKQIAFPDFGGIQNRDDATVKTRVHKERTELRQESEAEAARMLEFLRTDLYVWDMRVWRARTREEALKWIVTNRPAHKNCGHAGYCITELKRLGVPVETIVNAIMANPHIQFAEGPYIGESNFSGWGKDQNDGVEGSSAGEEAEKPSPTQRGEPKP